MGSVIAGCMPYEEYYEAHGQNRNTNGRLVNQIKVCGNVTFIDQPYYDSVKEYACP